VVQEHRQQESATQVAQVQAAVQTMQLVAREHQVKEMPAGLHIQ
jgi:hypothetical protein